MKRTPLKPEYYTSPPHTAVLSDWFSYIGSSCLDLGCGEGSKLVFVARHQKARNFFGADSNSSALKIAKKALQVFRLKASLVQCDARCLPFRDSFFDSIICSEVLEHIVDFQKALAEIKRCLVKGGYSILTTPTTSFAPLSIDFLQKKVLGNLLIDLHSGHVYRFDLRILIMELRNHGFSIEKVFQNGQYILPILLFLSVLQHQSNSSAKRRSNSRTDLSKYADSSCAVLSRLANNFLRILCTAEYKIFKASIFGSDAVIVLQK